MADVIRRYKMSRVGVIDTDRLARMIGGAVALTVNSPEVFIDATADAARSADLDEALSALGFDFVEEAPPYSGSDAAHAGFAGSKLKQEIDEAISVAAGQTLLLDDPVLTIDGSIVVEDDASLVVI
jgi:hypothetical protein